MAHHFQLKSRIYVNEDNHLILESVATYKDKELDISRLDYDSGKFSYRFGNLHFVNVGGGWLIEYPGEENTCPYYGGRYKVEEEPYEECDNEYSGLLDYSLMNSFEASEIIKKKPELKYLLNKLDYYNHPLTKLTTFKLMIMWKKHPLEVECLSQKGLYTIALNKNLYKLSLDKKKSVLQALKQLNNNDVNLQDIQSWLKLKNCSLSEYLELKEWNKYDRVRDSLETFRYCKRKNISRSNYHDMLKLASSLGHNIEDDYWKYPNDPNSVHNNLVIQKAEIDRLRIEEEAKKENIYWDKLEQIKNKICKNPIDIGNGYTLFFPTEFKQYDKAATTLHQCIITAKYYKKCAEGKSMIFMIWKNDTPSSTYEIDYNKNIIQAYADEWGYQDNNRNIKPSEYEMTMFNKFLETFKPKRLKEYLTEE